MAEERRSLITEQDLMLHARALNVEYAKTSEAYAKANVNTSMYSADEVMMITLMALEMAYSHSQQAYHLVMKRKLAQ